MKKILTSDQCRQLDKATMDAQSLTSLQLMERASQRLVESFCQLFTTDQIVWIYAGPGNNGGDGWCMARLLSEAGYTVTVVDAPDISRSPENEINRQRYIEGLKGRCVTWPDLSSFPSKKVVVIDALFGTGLSRPVEGIWCDIIDSINDKKVTICSIDVPSGLHSERGAIGRAVRADHTLSIHSVKLAYLLPECHIHVGQWHIVDIGLDKESEEHISTPFLLIDALSKTDLGWMERSPFSHKGRMGHAMIVAGSKGMIGAGILSTSACLRSGAGLTTTLIPACGHTALQISCPEAMALIDVDENKITSIQVPEKVNAVGLGPGLGNDKLTSEALEAFLKGSKNVHLVLDADALNIIASRELLSSIPPGTILTPHPGEFDRLFGPHTDRLSRIDTQRKYAHELEIYIVLKGRYTSISTPDGYVYFNNSGSPALSKGGSGDILTGLITGLLARTGDQRTAVILGVHLHGKAGEFAEVKLGKESVIGRDVIDEIGNTFKAALK